MSNDFDRLAKFHYPHPTSVGTSSSSDYDGYTYDAGSKLTEQRLRDGQLVTCTYDDLGRRVSLTRGNGVVTTYGYDAAARLSTLTHDLPGAAGDLTVTFDRNPAGQITSRTAFNDLYAWAGQPSPEIATSVNGRNQVTSQNRRSFAHDVRGNLTSDGVGTYGYDVDDRLSAAPGGATLDYDAVGRLYEAGNAVLAATRFLYDGSTLIAEYDASGNLLRRYVHGAGIDEPLVWYEGFDTSDRRWLAADERGSVIAATNGSGGVLAAYTYDEYGIPGPGNAGRFQYTGQTWIEAVGLYHYKSRFYDPRQGRFLQADRIGYAGGMNLYAYVDGDPINLIDPLGWDDAPPCSEQNVCTLVIVRAKRPRELKFGGGGSSLRFVPLMSDIFGPWVAATTGDLRTRDDESEEEGPDEDDYECTLSSLLDSVARNTTWTIGGGIGVGGKAFGRLNVQVFHAYGGAGGNFAGHTWSYVSGGGPAVEVKFGSVRAGFSTGGGTTRRGTHYFQEQSESAFAGYSSDAGTLDYGNRLHVPFIDLGISPDFAQIWREWRCSK